MKIQISILIVFTALSCGIPTIEYIDDPEFPSDFERKDVDGNLRLLFTSEYADENPTFDGYLILYKFFKQTDTTGANLTNILNDFNNSGVSNLTPDYLISSKGFFEISNGETNIFRPSLRLTRTSQEINEILITMVFSTLKEELNNPDITSTDISEPYFYLENTATQTPVTTFLGRTDGIVPFYRGIRDTDDSNKFFKFSDFFNLELSRAAEQQDLAHLNLLQEEGPVVLEIVFFIFGYGQQIGELASFSSPVAWETVHDFYQW